MGALGKLNEVDYVVRRPFFLKNVSPTTGGNAIGYNLSEDHVHNTLMKMTQKQSWVKQNEVQSIPYDIIYTYQIGNKID